MPALEGPCSPPNPLCPRRKTVALELLLWGVGSKVIPLRLEEVFVASFRLMSALVSERPAAGYYLLFSGGSAYWGHWNDQTYFLQCYKRELTIAWSSFK